MQVNISVDTEMVANSIEFGGGAYVDHNSDLVDGCLSSVVNAVIENLEFSFDRDDAEVGNVIQLPVSR